MDCSICSRPIEQEPPVLDEEGNDMHERCKCSLNLIRSPDSAQGQVAVLREQGLRRGMPFEAFMNYPYGIDSPAANSYRCLQRARNTMAIFNEMWCMGQFITGSQIDVYVRDDNPSTHADMQDDEKLAGLATIAQGILELAIVAWNAARTADRKRPDDVDMYLDENMYKGAWLVEFKYFVNRRNKAIAHATNRFWGSQNTSRPYDPYPDWSDDWPRFQKLLWHSISLCNEDICRKNNLPDMDTSYKGRVSQKSGEKALKELRKVFGSVRKWY